MKQLRILLVICIMLVTSFAGYSQEKYKHVGLTESDVKNYIKNFESLKEDFDNLRFDKNGEITIEMLAVLKGKPIIKQMNNICNKNGISGDNAVNKFTMISVYAPIVLAQYMVDTDPQMAIQFAALGVDPLSSYRGLVDDDDYLILYKYAADLKKIFSSDDEE